MEVDQAGEGFGNLEAGTQIAADVKGARGEEGTAPSTSGQPGFRSPGNQHHQEAFVREAKAASDRKFLKSYRSHPLYYFIPDLLLDEKKIKFHLNAPMLPRSK